MSEASTDGTVRFVPLLRKLRQEEWTVELAERPIPRVPAIRFDAGSIDRGFVAEPGFKVGKYVLEDKLGQGTFGTVYTARDSQLERRVAFKVLNPSHQTNSDVVTRFLQEARATARINHAGIVTILDCGRLSTDAGDLAYIVMELLEGESLTARIDRLDRLDPAMAIDIGYQVAGALDAAHRADVLHRDVKPDNIFIVRDPLLASGERVKVLDFGLAKLGRGGHTMQNTILGTPRYMSPEQTRSSARIDARSDVYSLGCILFEMITGRRPFGGDLVTLVDHHQRTIPPRVRTVVPKIPVALDDLIAKMLAKDPAARPQSMSEVQRSLQVAQKPHLTVVVTPSMVMPVVAPPRTPPQPPSKEKTNVAYPPPPPGDPLDANTTLIVHPLPRLRPQPPRPQPWLPIGCVGAILVATLATQLVVDDPVVARRANVVDEVASEQPPAPPMSAWTFGSESAALVAPSSVNQPVKSPRKSRHSAQSSRKMKKSTPKPVVVQERVRPKWDPDTLFLKK